METSPSHHSLDTGSQVSTVPPRRGWFAFGIADLLLLVLVIGMIQRSQGSMLDDPGLGWHIRHIDAMWAEGGWLTHDPFSGPRQGQPWRTNQWLGDVLLYLGWWWGGLEGIAAVTTLILALTFRLLYGMLRSDDVPWPLAVGWTLLAALATSSIWVARPNVLTLPLVMLTAWMLDRYHRGKCRRATTWWLVPLFALWANAHGGFVAGLVLVLLTLIVECGFSLSGRSAARREATGRLKHLACLLPACVLATFVNPYGWSLYPWIFQLLGNEFFMNLHVEWLSPDFHARGAFRFELLMLALPLLLALSPRRSISAVALLQSILWLHFALNGQRYVALWVVITVPLLARLSTDLVARLLRWSRWLHDANPVVSNFHATRPSGSGPPVAATTGSPWALVLVTVGLLGWAACVDGYSRHDPRRIPVAALDYVVRHHAGEVVFHEYGWGGWLVWHGWPSVKNWIDDRNEVQGREHIEQYFRIIQARGGWQEALDRHGVRVACLPVNCPLAEQLAVDPSWRLRYRDKYALVYENATPGAQNSESPVQAEHEQAAGSHAQNRKLSLLRDVQ